MYLKQMSQFATKCFLSLSLSLLKTSSMPSCWHCRIVALCCHVCWQIRTWWRPVFCIVPLTEELCVWLWIFKQKQSLCDCPQFCGHLQEAVVFPAHPEWLQYSHHRCSYLRLLTTVWMWIKLLICSAGCLLRGWGWVLCLRAQQQEPQ